MNHFSKKDSKKKYAADFIKYKDFYELIVDGKFLGVLLPGKDTEAEVARLTGYAGIKIIPARSQTLININAKIDLPKRLINYFASQSRKFEKAKKSQGICL